MLDINYFIYEFNINCTYVSYPEILGKKIPKKSKLMHNY